MNNDNEELYPCPVCKGKPVSDQVVESVTFTNCICDFCWGKKYLTWVEMVFGIDRSYHTNRLNRLFHDLLEKVDIERRKN
jgi:hypothetical protein